MVKLEENAKLFWISQPDVDLVEVTLCYTNAFALPTSLWRKKYKAPGACLTHLAVSIVLEDPIRCSEACGGILMRKK